MRSISAVNSALYVVGLTAFLGGIVCFFIPDTGVNLVGAAVELVSGPILLTAAVPTVVRCRRREREDEFTDTKKSFGNLRIGASDRVVTGEVVVVSSFPSLLAEHDQEVLMRKTLIAGIGAGALIAVSAALPAAAADGDASLSVLHAVPGVTVDVYVNNALTLDDFTPGTLAGPLPLPAGTYSVAITASDAADASSPIIGPIDLPLAANGNYTAVAHLDAAGTPTATLYTNDTSTLAAGEGRLTVRHDAAAPAVDILAGGSPVITNLSNPAESVLTLPAGTVSASVAATGTTTPVIGPADVNVAEGTNTIVYAWGSLEDGNLALAVQTISGLHSNPGGVPAGSAGLVATNQPTDSAPLWMGAALVLLVGATVGGLSIRRRATAKAGR